MSKASKIAKSNVVNCEAPLDPTDLVKGQIFIARGQRVTLDRDLARLYGVTTKRLNQQFTRNRNRFPKDFVFRLTLQEAKQIARLRLQNATLKRGQHIKHPPHVFTEHGAIMLASVLNSRVAVQSSVYVVRAFVQMRGAIIEYAQLSKRIDALAEQYDDRFIAVFEAIRALMKLPEKRRRSIGFVSNENDRRKV
jgi:hypothetical protein